jgi:hypothetical protein
MRIARLMRRRGVVGVADSQPGIAVPQNGHFGSHVRRWR